ncbi:MAG: trigger factor [Proteobacteria bacterium]|nr:trigger factor [Pseudomonadota bacterium]MBU2226477.1 trigger factor [Pseudomonadota bacterium]MBU2262753.1 trigger factor [Pseudomonadota bacterium]
MSDISAAVNIESISSVKMKLSFDIPWADVKSELDAVYRQVGKTAKIKGFRPGRIPREILERYYRRQAEEETASNLVNRQYWKTLQEKQIPAVTRPEIEQKEIEAEKEFSFSATFEVEPVIEPQDYLGLELEKEEPVVTEEDLAARMQELRKMFATMEETHEERGVLPGDFVTIDYEGSLAGEMLKELKSENYFLEIGSNAFVSGFEDQLIGMKNGETGSIAVKFPETYNASHLAGKDVAFTVRVKGIRVKKLPEIDEEFIKNFERYDSLEALRAEVRKAIEEEKRRRSDAELERHIYAKLLENNDFEVPGSLVELEIYHMMSDAQRRMAAGGMDPKRAADFSFRLHDQFREEALRTVKVGLLLKSIAAKEALQVGEDELEKEIREIALQRDQDYQTVRVKLEKDDLIENIRNVLLNRKTYEFLREKATITPVRKERTETAEEGK